MAEIKVRELIHHCCEVNASYMRFPAGMLKDYQAIASLYQRLADQSLLCASFWLREKRCPPHDPAVDAFWWGVVAWADAFGLSIQADPVEWGRKFVGPHHSFANYLRPGEDPQVIGLIEGTPADIIMELDRLWMELVVKLTRKWGWLHHLKDMPALVEVYHLASALKQPASPARKAYLESDLKFFRALFQPFPFSEETKQHIHDWLARVEESQ